MNDPLVGTCARQAGLKQLAGTVINLLEDYLTQEGILFLGVSFLSNLCLSPELVPGIRCPLLAQRLLQVMGQHPGDNRVWRGARDLRRRLGYV